MSLFKSILEKLGIGRANASPQAAPEASATAGASGQPGGQSSAPTAPAPTQSAAAPVDIGAKLDGLAAQSSEKLNWRTSIVDLLKLLSIDSSLSNRKELAQELSYTGSTDDSAAMNIWLHKAVLKKLSENGGQVPADLLD